MKVLALDIGSGTEDVLLYDSNRNIENCIKMVLPSPTPLLAKKIRLFHGRDLFVEGDTVGGGSLNNVIKEHLKTGYKVYVTEKAAFTLYNDLNRVKSLGIKITAEPPENFKGAHLILEEVNLETLRQVLGKFGENLDDLDAVAVAVQDHGVSPKGVSQNQFRIEKMKELLASNPDLQTAIFTEEEIPCYYLRLKAAAAAVKRSTPNVKPFVMDTVLAAILGCLQDPSAEKGMSLMVINMGNSHTTAAIITNSRVVGFMEHHTHFLTANRLRAIIEKFEKGILTNEEVAEENGHGAFYLSRTEKKIESILATGPKRSLLKETGLAVQFASPGGDVMMTGTIGLVEAVKAKLQKNGKFKASKAKLKV